MAEKMLTNWFAFLLHKFLKVRRERDGAGPSEPGMGTPSGTGTYLTRAPQSPEGLGEGPGEAGRG